MYAIELSCTELTAFHARSQRGFVREGGTVDLSLDSINQYPNGWYPNHGITLVEFHSDK